MAFARSARRNSGIVLAPRRTAVVSKSRFEALKERSNAAARRIKQAGEEDGDAMVSVAAGVALALYEKPSKENPNGRELPTIMGLDPAVAWGAGAYLLTRKSKNKSMRLVRQAAIGVLTIGANRSATRGSIKTSVAGDSPDSYDDDDDDL